MAMQTLTQRLANPTRFMALSARLLPWIAGVAGVLIAAGLFLAFTAPLDYQQGHTAKIMFVHVPAAWLAMFGYALVALSSFGLLVFRHPLADVSAKAAAPIGAAFTFICLVTGSLWGKPMWGAFWVWDPRLTSVLILFFLYLGLIALRFVHRGRIAGRQADGGAGAGRDRHPPRHQVLGRLEQPAPAGQRHAHGQAYHPCLAALSIADHGCGYDRTVPGAAPQSHAQRDPSPAREIAAHGHRGGDRSLGACSGGAMMDLGPHAAFIWAAYGVAAAVIGGLIAWFHYDGRRQQQLIDELEARGVRRRSERKPG